MRAVIQRVTEARVLIAGAVKGATQAGLLVLLGVEEADTAEDIEWLSGKIVRLRIFRDAEGLMNHSVQESGGGILVVSQFTLFASTKKGNRPSYSRVKELFSIREKPQERSQPCRRQKANTGDSLRTERPVTVASFRTWRDWRGASGKTDVGPD